MKLPWIRSRPADALGERARAVRALAGLLRAGLSPREALSIWHEDVPEALSEDLERMARRIALGETTTEALSSASVALGTDAQSLQVLFGMSSLLGGDFTRSIDGLAETIEKRRASQQETLAAVAGMTLSARIIAGLPLLCIPFGPASGAPLNDPAGLMLVIVGATLAVTGMRWMRHLTPEPPETEDGVCAAARAVAGALSGGAGLHLTLETAARHAPPDVRAELQHAQRLTHLGLSWPSALRRTSSEGLIGMSVALERATRKGLPVATALEAFAQWRDAEAQRALDRSVRRAPIFMSIPLVVCVLPSFLLLGVAPFLRGLAL